MFDQKTAQKYFVYSCQTVFESSKVLCTVRPIPLKFVLYNVAFIPYLQIFRSSVQFTNHILTKLTSNTYLGLIQTHDNSSDRCWKSTPILLKQVNKNKFVQINGLKYFTDTCVKNRDIDSLIVGNRGIKHTYKSIWNSTIDSTKYSVHSKYLRLSIHFLVVYRRGLNALWSQCRLPTNCTLNVVLIKASYI